MPESFDPSALPNRDEPSRSPAASAARVPGIIIIGGGFAGTVTAIRLLDGATDPLAITIIEKGAELGRGLACPSRDPVHVMDGPAKLFSLYPERPGHFAHFLARLGGARFGSNCQWSDREWHDPQGPDYTNAHAPRWIYCEYLRAELTRAIAHAAPGVTLRHIGAEAHDLRQALATVRTDGGPGMNGNGIIVTLESGSKLRADQAVLALGVCQGRPELAVDPTVRSSGRTLEAPSDRRRLETLPRTGRVLPFRRSLGRHPLVTNLLARGLVRTGPLSFGIDADWDAAVIGRDGRRSDTVTAIGPALRGVRWDFSTIPELQQQATELAEHLLNRVHAPCSTSNAAAFA